MTGSGLQRAEARAIALARRELAPIELHPREYLLIRIGLTVAFVYSGLDKLLRFDQAVAEFSAMGLQPAAPLVLLTIVAQLGGSTLILLDRIAWVGALILAAFTLYATFVGHAFWTMTGPARNDALNSFLEHFGLVAVFVLLASASLRKA